MRQFYDYIFFGTKIDNTLPLTFFIINQKCNNIKNCQTINQGGYIRFWVFPLRNSITRCPWTSICKRCLKPLRRDGNFLEAFEFLSDNAQLTYPPQNVKSKNSIDKLKNSNDCIFLSGEHMDQTKAQCLGLKKIVSLV